MVDSGEKIFLEGNAGALTEYLAREKKDLRIAYLGSQFLTELHSMSKAKTKA